MGCKQNETSPMKTLTLLFATAGSAAHHVGLLNTAMILFTLEFAVVALAECYRNRRTCK